MQNLVHGIKNKVVIITGESSGIGEATALMLAERDAKVVLGARGLSSRVARGIGKKSRCDDFVTDVCGTISRSPESIASGVTDSSAATFLTVSCFLRSS